MATFVSPLDSVVSTQGPNLNSMILKTKDGGKTWIEIFVEKAGGGFSGIGFIDEITGWVANEVLFETTDGGIT